jgi:hypothetical protein
MMSSAGDQIGESYHQWGVANHTTSPTALSGRPVMCRGNLKGNRKAFYRARGQPIPNLQKGVLWGVAQPIPNLQKAVL